MKFYFEFTKSDNKYLIKNHEKILLIIKDYKLSLSDVFDALFKNHLLECNHFEVELINKTDDDASSIIYERVKTLISEVAELINEFISSQTALI